MTACPARGQLSGRTILFHAWLAWGLIALTAAGALAAPAPARQVRRVAENLVANHVAIFGSWNGDTRPALGAAEVVQLEGVPLAYNIRVKPSGHVLVAYDDQFSPVLLYSDKSDFEPSRVGDPNAVESWILPELLHERRKIDRLAAEGRAPAHAGSRVRRAWERFGTEGVFVPDRRTTRSEAQTLTGEPAPMGIVVPPLTATTWNQSSPYWNYTPADNGCAHTYTGCVATSVAQVLKYWGVPATGVGTHSYTWKSQTLSADFTHAYDWSIMPNSLSGASAPAIDAVARLISDVGIAVNMNYGCSGSAASLWTATQAALPDHFRFTTGTEIDRSIHSDIFAHITADLDLSRPVLFAVWNASSGHALVIDGYQDGSGEMVHLNLGWGSYADGWYNLATDFTTGSYTWDASTEVVYTGVVPRAPAVSSPSPTDGATGVLLPVTLYWTGAGAGTITYDVYFGTNPASLPRVSTDQGSMSYAPSGVLSATTYYWYIVAKETGGESTTGPTWSFTTQGPVTTGSATSITSDGATLNGQVNPGGVPTTAYFQYGLTTAYGASTSPQSAGSGSAPVAVAQSIAGLTCATAYHFRVVATNAGGTTAGSDATFTTTACAANVSAYDVALKAPMCAAPGASCDSGTLLQGRRNFGPEPNQPNTIASSCADGAGGTAYHTDESNDRLQVTSVDGGPLSPGRTVRVDATVWAYSGDYLQDRLDLYYAADATSPAWTFLTTLQPAAGGANSLSAQFNLPAGSLQAVRAGFRYAGSAAPCTVGDYDDHDDLVFAVRGPRSDFSGDSKSDILWRHATGGQIWIWPMSGVTPLSKTYISTVADTDWEVRGVLDVTGDTKADIVWRNKASGGVFLWTMNGTSVTAQNNVATVNPAYDIVGTGDYNGDGRADLLWRHKTSGELWVWLMNGATRLSATNVATIPVAYEVAASGDVNGDGKADILWRNAANGEVWVWLMNGASVTSQTLLAIVGDPGYRVAGTSDADRDGKSDVVWRHETSGAVWIWLMNGTALKSVASLGTVGDTGYRIVSMADYDGDGRADLLWRHQATGELWMWRLNGASVLSATPVSTVDPAYEVAAPK